jgi:N-acetylglutamate synthase-like GNAT family acetyltransferase
MAVIEQIELQTVLTIRNELLPGDLGWIVRRHGQIYSEEFGRNTDFEALVAEIAGKIAQNFDPACERIWIAELEGRFAGCVFLVRNTGDQAKLRLLIVEPDARGHGLGKRLVDECIRFARDTGYRSITLWTNDVPTGARRIYANAGFQCVASEPAPASGQDLISETWELVL